MTSSAPAIRARVRRAVLLAAGRGSRLRPHTDTVPKPLLPWRGRPSLDHLVDALEAAGIDEIVIVTGHLAQAVDAWVVGRIAGRAGAPGGGSAGARLSTVSQPRLGGTADALERVIDARPAFLAERFVLAATDYLVGADFIEDFLAFDATHAAGASVSLKRLGADGARARSSVRFDASASTAPAAPSAPGDAAEVLEVVEKPVPGTAPSDVAANLAFVLPPAVVPHVRRSVASERGEREVQSALNAWLREGGRCRGLLQPVPAEWTPPA